MQMKNNLLLLFFVCGLLALRCGFTPVAGGSTDTELGCVVTGMVYDKFGMPASQTRINLIPQLYNPVSDAPLPDSLTDTTDSEGKYMLSKIPKGAYTLLADQRISNQKLLITGISIGSKDTQQVNPDTLQQTGSIAVEFLSPIDSVNGYVYIPGTTFFAPAAMHAVLRDIPSGHIPAINYAHSTDMSKSFIIDTNVNVIAGSTIVINNYYTWSFSKRIFLNTTAAGADVRNDVTGFPVLVRLTNKNFDFGQSTINGRDIRFAKADGSQIPFEMEQWDSSNGRAEIWVKMDTVYGNNDNQYIVMYWGNASAQAVSNSAAVFDSSSGYQGVWHLNETSGITAFDVSYNRFSGIYKGGLPANEISPSGICQKVTKPDIDYVDIGKVLDPGMKNISVGIWLKRATLGTQQALIAKTNGDGPSATYGYLFSIDLLNYPHFYLVSGGSQWGDTGTFDLSSNLTITDSTSWHYVSVTIDRSSNNNCKLYIDGIDRTGTIRGDVSLVRNVINTCNLRIGTENDNNYSYNGSIAEATIAFVTRSPDWVKLYYMNQKDLDALVKW
jgi:hypothetical protein